MRRAFNRSERRALFLAAGGRCERCGAPLKKGWHADHIQAYAVGGSTDVVNGQALCPKCNQLKGSSTMKIRQWQVEFDKDFFQKMQAGQIDYLLVATPGAGKTFASLNSGNRLLGSICDRLVIVTPTEHLKKQWHDKAKELGVQLNPDWTGTAPEKAGYHGVVVTYHSLPTQKAIHRTLCARKKTLVIFDEIHHLGDRIIEGDGQIWAESAREAFDGAVRRLGLSGTPFRTDGARLPFVNYVECPDKPGVLECKPDINYRYSQALKDKVVRESFFPHIDGNASWIGRHGEQQAMVSEQLSENLDRERTRTILDPDSHFIRFMFERANAKLSMCRETGHRNAGGLVIASTVPQAERYMQLMTSICGERATMVVSNHSESGTIDGFRSSNSRWLVAVQMVSEGVDIDRLRVLVYATRCKTEVFFRQAVGRVVRKTAGLKSQPAYVFIYEHPTLREYASKIEAEVEEAILVEPERQPTKTGGGGGGGGESDYIFQPLYAEGAESNTLAGTVILTPTEVAEGAEMRASHADLRDIPDEYIAKVLKASRGGESAPDSAAREPEPESVHEEELRLRKACNEMAYKIDKHCDLEIGTTHTRWLKNGGSRQEKAPVTELRSKHEWLKAECVRLNIAA
jgi:superfamily II DNA or RNA helicase